MQFIGKGWRWCKPDREICGSGVGNVRGEQTSARKRASSTRLRRKKNSEALLAAEHWNCLLEVLNSQRLNAKLLSLLCIKKKWEEDWKKRRVEGREEFIKCTLYNEPAGLDAVVYDFLPLHLSTLSPTFPVLYFPCFLSFCLSQPSSILFFLHFSYIFFLPFTSSMVPAVTSNILQNLVDDYHPDSFCPLPGDFLVFAFFHYYSVACCIPLYLFFHKTFTSSLSLSCHFFFNSLLTLGYNFCIKIVGSGRTWRRKMLLINF